MYVDVLKTARRDSLLSSSLSITYVDSISYRRRVIGVKRRFVSKTMLPAFSDLPLFNTWDATTGPLGFVDGREMRRFHLLTRFSLMIKASPSPRLVVTTRRRLEADDKYLPCYIISFSRRAICNQVDFAGEATFPAPKPDSGDAII